MPDRSTVKNGSSRPPFVQGPAYRSDGSFEGLLCCVFESYTRREWPAELLEPDAATLFPIRDIAAVPAHADRVWRSLVRMGGEVCGWIRDGWNSCAAGRERVIFDFIRAAYQYGSAVTDLLSEHSTAALFRLVRAQRNEAHLLIEFARFSDFGGALVCVIDPKSIVLAEMGAHFSARFPEETFMIFDRTHGLALFYRPYASVIRPVDDLTLPPADDTERRFRDLWRHYYRSIAVEGRYNPKCRMTHMAKRFWANMPELDYETGVLRAEEAAALKGPPGPMALKMDPG